jgi:peptidoglycan hydrolase-like protein with peptidoglycan-binding domain
MNHPMTAIAAALFAATTSFGALAQTGTPSPATTPAAQPPATQTPAAQAPAATAPQAKPAAVAPKMAATPAKPAVHHAMMSRHYVEEVQAALQGEGANIAVDGLWGPKTTMALRDYQKKNGLPATGHFDHRTAAKLKVPHWKG